MDTIETIQVEVAYAQPTKQMLIPVTVLEGATVSQAIENSGILVHFPEIDLQKNRTGIFSKPATLQTVLREGDRVEIYRPLIADPKMTRKQKATDEKTY